MKTYSSDLEERVAVAVDPGEGSMREIADGFRIGPTTLVHW
jgi:hypothetical protein